MRAGWIVLASLALAACKTRTVSCHTPDLMCHEWHEADNSLADEIRDAVCHHRDETFIDGTCSRANVFGICTQGTQVTIWYRTAENQFDGASTCASTGGTWSTP